MSDEALWGIALAVGLVVAVVAAGLLHVFYREVRRIERGAAGIWETGKQVAANTATTWVLADTAAELDGVIEEAGRHRELLDRPTLRGS